MFDYCLHIKITHCLMICITITLFLTFFVAYFPLTDECNCPKDSTEVNSFKHYSKEINRRFATNEHKLAVLVPYRNRFEELLEFVPYIDTFLNNQNINHHIFILNQVDSYRFNRASLINVGFRFVKNEYDYIAMHDVDLLPLNPKLSYQYPQKQPFHIASPELHPKYHYPTFVGGILLINREQFIQVNGMSNNYWGWGLEDDEFYVRLKDAKLNVSRPVDIDSGTSDSFRHIHDKNHRKRDMTKCFNQREITRKRDRITGLNNVIYQISAVKNCTIDGAPLTILNIELSCNRKVTPWCDCSDATASNIEKITKTQKKKTKA